MARTRWAVIAALGMLSALATPGLAGATVSVALSLDEMVDHADHVALVTCESAQASRDDRGRIVTDYTLRVEESMKGDGGATLTMRSLGGVIGDLGMRVEGEPHPELGRRYVVFLERRGGQLRAVGMSQGVMPVTEQGGTLTVAPGGAGMSLVQRVRGGQLSPAPAALLHPEPYLELRTRIGARVSGE